MQSPPRHSMMKNLPIALLVGLVCVPVASASLTSAELDDTRLAMAGSGLSAEQAAQLEANIAETPDDYPTRVQLLGYYFLRQSEADREAREKHVMWFIQNHPGARFAGSPYAQLDSVRYPAAYVRASDLWLQQTTLHAHDPQVLGNAAQFFFLEDRQRAEDLLKRAQGLDPANPAWAQQLGHLYSLGANRESTDSRRRAADQSLEQLESALAMTDAMGRRAMLVSAAKAAFEAGDLDGARSYALELLEAPDKSSWNYGNAVHQGNLILGRLALKAGDVEQAKLHLTEAGKTTGSPQLNSFGPNMMLAKELLERDERQVVLDYFTLCGEFWPRHDRLEAWATDVEAGRIPDFEANLSY